MAGEISAGSSFSVRVSEKPWEFDSVEDVCNDQSAELKDSWYCVVMVR